MNKVLKDPIGVRVKKDGQSEWSFAAPSYNNRTSSSIPAGDYYGTGHRNPSGKESAKGPESGPIPQKAHCFSPHEIFDHEKR